jgi:hypothetical protein
MTLGQEAPSIGVVDAFNSPGPKRPASSLEYYL